MEERRGEERRGEEDRWKGGEEEPEGRREEE